MATDESLRQARAGLERLTGRPVDEALTLELLMVEIVKEIDRTPPDPQRLAAIRAYLEERDRLAGSAA